MIDSQITGDDYYYVATDIDMESNVTKNTELFTSTLVARQLTENTYDIVDSEEEMYSEDLTITGDYSDYDIFGGRKGYYYRKRRCLGQNKK